jgi:ribulose-5-phosphate 4-epimerase/fuculose-1-phosphate aldolase
MKVYIIQELNQYSIYKVADHLIEHFENEKKDCIVIEGKSIAEVVTKFDALEKLAEIEFNAELIKYKNTIRENDEEGESTKQSIRIKQRRTL